MDSSSAKTYHEGTSSAYYLQTVPNGEEPDWPCPSEELVVGHQPLDGDLIQYWAYFKESGKDPSEQPRAEVVASEYKTGNPAVLIDEYPGGGGESLELILVKGGHALAKTESSVDNLEDNISSVLETAKKKFDLEVEHFMTTDRVSKEVEKKLDDLEETEEDSSSHVEHAQHSHSDVLPFNPDRTGINQDQRPEQPEQTRSDFGIDEQENDNGIKKVNSQMPTGGIYSTQKKSSDNISSSKLWLILPIILLVLAFVGVVGFMKKDDILSKLNFGAKAEVVEVTPTPQPTEAPTPTPSIERKQFKVRVLNGTKTAGAAAKLGDKLKELGWEVLSVGNNKDQTIEQTLVNSKESVATASGTLISDLSSDYEASEGAALKASDKADLEIIIGAK